VTHRHLVPVSFVLLPLLAAACEGDPSGAAPVSSSDAGGVEVPDAQSGPVDTTPPKTTITKAPPALDNSVDVTFEFVASEKASFRCSLDAAPPAPCTSPLAVSKLGDGQHVFSVAATDEAGNEETPAVTHPWTVDTALPDTTIDSGPTGAVSTDTSVFTFSSPAKNATFECALDTGVFAACTSPHTVTTADEASHTLRVRARTASGNVDPTPAERTWSVDKAAPIVTITGGPTGMTNQKAGSFTFTASETATTECRIGGAFAACTSPYAYGPLADGVHTFEVRATDLAGNAGAAATQAFTVDTAPPAVAVTSGPTTMPVGDAVIAFTAEAGAATACRLYESGTTPGAFVPCTSPATYTVLTAKNWVFEVRATDTAGNSAIATWNFATYIIG
jgi:hypothetical protein